jgi:hypothetical protein
MAPSKCEKAAHRVDGGDLQEIERFGRQLDYQNTRNLIDLQAYRISNRFGLSEPTAHVLAHLIYGGGAQ